MKLYCVIGDNRVVNSRSPLMHKSVFSEFSPESNYLAFSVEEKNLAGAVTGLKALGFNGANVTVPHKEAIVSLLDGLSSEATVIGAVNTIVRDEDNLIGYNTDVLGFSDLMKFAGFSDQESVILILGSGGAARAVLKSLTGNGYNKIWVANRTFERCSSLTQNLGGYPISIESVAEVFGKINVLINTTSVSSTLETTAFDLMTEIASTRMRNLKLVIDINYGRDTNIWSGLAYLNQARFLDGLYMLAAQGRKSFELWTGQTVPLSYYLKSLGL